ncbi:MAG: asparagine synthase (glutamine-hydrolyzing) [Syntrophorhabdaceae bacterium]|nr:asparagine synthase (glutamine-hydrolyzing) [Syntrophorhabdaceae bacterium]
MCGIIGFNWKNKEQLNKAMVLMNHRGPDDEGFYVDDEVSLGHRRLSIIDLTSAGRQPMTDSEARYYLIFNGEIYNYIELKDELKRKGHRFSTDTDSEVIIYAYKEWGEKALNRFNGMFAFCIYDSVEKRLFLARDRFGVKPLYYQFHNNRFIFSSEIKPILLLSDRAPAPHETAIFDYLLYNFYNYSENTFFEGIYSLLPGHYMFFDLVEKQLSVKRWYDIPLENRWTGGFEDASDKFRELFVDAIRLRLRSDVEIGTCLSGGLDSSSIVCNLKQFGPRFTDRFKSFSVVFDDPSIDESPYIHEVIHHGDFEGYFTTPSVDDLLNDVTDLITHQEEPFGGTSIFAQWCVMKLTHSHNVKVLLDGQGGDELLGGYPFFFAYLFLEKLKKMKLIELLGEIRGYRRHFREHDAFLMIILLMLSPSLKVMAMSRYFHSAINKDFIKRYAKDSVYPSVMYSLTDLNKALYNRMRFSLPQLLREEDKNSMSFSIEARLPFLDYRVVEFLFSLPSDFKLHNGLSKHILRESMRGVLPEKIYRRTLKLGFPTPLEEWIRDERFGRFMEDVIFSETSKKRGYYDMDILRQVFEGHRRRRLDATQILWKTFNLEMWFKIFIEKKGIYN